MNHACVCADRFRCYLGFDMKMPNVLLTLSLCVDCIKHSGALGAPPSPLHAGLLFS